MQCGQCWTEFCWICGNFYYSGHYTDTSVFGCPGMQFSGPCVVACMWLLRAVLSLLAMPFAAAGTLVLLPILLLAHYCNVAFSRPPLFQGSDSDASGTSGLLVFPVSRGRCAAQRLSRQRVVYKGYLWLHRALAKLPIVLVVILFWIVFFAIRLAWVIGPWVIKLIRRRRGN